MEDRWADAVEKEALGRLSSVLLMLVESEGIMTREGSMIPTRYTYRQLSSMIGSNREAVTRAFSNLQEVVAVEVESRQVYVRDSGVLRQTAGE